MPSEKFVSAPFNKGSEDYESLLGQGSAGSDHESVFYLDLLFQRMLETISTKVGTIEEIVKEI